MAHITFSKPLKFIVIGYFISKSTETTYPSLKPYPPPKAAGEAFRHPFLTQYKNDYMVLDDDYHAAKTLGTTGFSRSNETRAGMTIDGNGACSL